MRKLQPRLENEFPRFYANICFQTDRVSIAQANFPPTIVGTFLSHGVVGDKNRTNLCLIIADKNVIEKTRRVLRKKNDQSGNWFSIPQLSRYRSLKRETRALLCFFRSEMEINHGFVEINYFDLMALVPRCDMFWEIFSRRAKGFVRQKGSSNWKKIKYRENIPASLIFLYESKLTSPQHVSHFKRSLNLSLVLSKSRINIWRCTHENDLLKQNRFLSFLAFKGIAKLKIIRETIFALFMFLTFLYKVFHKGVKDKRECLGWCVCLMPHPTCQPVDEEREEAEKERS